MKTCSKCGEAKPFDAFTKRGDSDRLRSQCRACRSASERDRSREYHGRPEVRERKRAYDAARAGDPAHLAVKRASYRAKREQYVERSRRYQRAHPGKVNAATAARDAARRQRTVAWADPVAIAAVYQQAARVSRCLGVEHHVDHVVPLRGRKVSGLHVQTNLRVLPARLNVRKNNRFEVAA